MTNALAARQYVLIVPDGAADLDRSSGASPLARARTPYMDFVARHGVNGVAQTLFPGLPRESMVAQLGMLGWDPRIYYPHGRASSELLALGHVELSRHDLVFRANLVRMAGNVLESYNAHYITGDSAASLIHLLNSGLRSDFPDFELYYNMDFRNSLVIRNAPIDPRLLICPEPHECHGMEFDLDNLICGMDEESRIIATRINDYLSRVHDLLAGQAANMIFPWSASKAFRLPSFRSHTGWEGPSAVVGCMDFLCGICKAGGMEFFKRGNGRPDTNYREKGEQVRDLLEQDYQFVMCHINAPDEASHMGDLALKVRTIEQVDSSVVQVVVEYFQRNRHRLGGVMIMPDHYTNTDMPDTAVRRQAHTADPAPFAIWNGRERDDAAVFSEDGARSGWYGASAIESPQLLAMLGGSSPPSLLHTRHVSNQVSACTSFISAQS